MLNGRKTIITGGDRGFGFAIASEFVKQGADICICSRNEEALAEAAARLSDLAGSGQRVIYKKADIADTADTDSLFAFALSEFGGGLDAVVNNAGIQGPIGRFEENDWDEVLQVIRVNLLGTMYSIRKAISVFKEAVKKDGSGKDKSIVNISGGGATGARPYFMGYAVAKTGVVRATETAAAEAAEFGIRVNAIAPGAMNTRMLEEILGAGEKAGGEYGKSLKQKENGGASMEKAARLAAFLASEEASGITGRLISAVWDRWDQLESHAEELKESDIYTLRRIIPSDRGFNWD